LKGVRSLIPASREWLLQIKHEYGAKSLKFVLE
jgi:hypothetical protein